MSSEDFLEEEGELEPEATVDSVIATKTDIAVTANSAITEIQGQITGGRGDSAVSVEITVVASVTSDVSFTNDFEKECCVLTVRPSRASACFAKASAEAGRPWGFFARQDIISSLIRESIVSGRAGGGPPFHSSVSQPSQARVSCL